MAYTKEQKNEIFNSIILEIGNGASLRAAITNTKLINRDTFNEWIKEDEQLSDQYARAREDRAELIFEQIIDIADSQEGDIIHKDGIDIVNHDVIQRARLRIDARKWMLGKMDKKKYGDAIDMTTDGEKIYTVPIFTDNGLN